MSTRGPLGLQRPGAVAGIHREGQSGAALAFAIVFIFTIFTILTGLFDYSAASSRTLKSYRKERAIHYAADAALEAGVQYVRKYNYLGTTFMAGTAEPKCELKVPMVIPTITSPITYGSGKTAPSAIATFTQVSYLTVKCFATPNAPYSGGGVSGGQGVRDVTFQVTCGYTSSSFNSTNTGGLNDCGAGGNSITVAQARVQYQQNLAYINTTNAACAAIPPGGPYTDTTTHLFHPSASELLAADAAQCNVVNAVVPKVVTWTVYRLT